MHRTRKFLVWSIPYIIWGLFFYMGYIILSNIIGIGIAQESVYTMESCYSNGLLMVLPLIIYRETEKKIKHLWTFLVVGIVVPLAILTISNNYILVVFSAFIWIVYLRKRVNKEESFLAEVQPTLLLVYFVYLILTATQGYEEIQKAVLCALFVSAILTFVWHGIDRFQQYIILRKDKANMPVDKIRYTGTRIYVILILVLVVVFAPIIAYQYEFWGISFEEYYSEYEAYEMEVETSEQTEASYDFSDLVEVKEPNYLLVMLWNMLEIIMGIAVVLLIIVVSVKMIIKLLHNFQKVEFDKDDVIVSTIIIDKEEWNKKRKIKLEEIFDFSYEMRIRRKYKRELNKYKPKKWQTPSEMEEMASLEIPELHQQYEEVRYGIKKVEEM